MVFYEGKKLQKKIKNILVDTIYKTSLLIVLITNDIIESNLIAYCKCDIR